MQAIQTKFLPCTNARGARVKAWAEAGSVTVSWNYALDIEENHKAAAEALRKKLGWTHPNYGRLVGGALPAGGYAFVFDRPAPLTDYVRSQIAHLGTADNYLTVKLRSGAGECSEMSCTRDQLARIAAILSEEGN